MLAISTEEDSVRYTTMNGSGLGGWYDTYHTTWTHPTDSCYFEKNTSNSGRYCYPYMETATTNDFAEHAPGYRYAEELAALIAPDVIAAARDLRLGGYADF